MINRIYKASGERIWRWRFRHSAADGKIQDVSLGTSDKQVAEKKRSELLREKEHERAGLLPYKNLRESLQLDLSVHVAKFISDLVAKGRNRQYISELQNKLEILRDECGWRTTQDITADSFVGWRSSQSKAPKTLNEYLTCAKGFANWLFEHGRMSSNPLATVKKVETRGREVRPRRAFNDSEFAALLSVAGPQRIVYLTAALTGIRQGELKEIRWGDINLAGEKPSITVRASVSKNHKLACLPLHPALVEELIRFRPADAASGDAAFNGLILRSKQINAHLAAAKITKVDSQGRVVDFHSLRHTFCTNLHRAGVSQREAMELMRHNDPRLTATTYTDTSLLSLRTAVQKIEVLPSPIASLFSGPTSLSESSPVAVSQGVEIDKKPVNTSSLSLFDAARLVLSNIQKWCAIQGSNLRKAAISLGNAQGDAQGNAQILVALGRDLSQVVTDRAKLPTPLKAAVLAIINSTKGQP